MRGVQVVDTSTPLLQSVTFGPLTARELVVRNWTWVSHTSLAIVTPPGVGLGHRVTLTVADQVGVGGGTYSTPIFSTYPCV